MDETIIEAMKATIVEAFTKSGPSFSVRMTSGITAPQVNHIECTFDLEAVTRAAWDAAKAALAEAGMILAPKVLTPSMRRSAEEEMLSAYDRNDDWCDAKDVVEDFDADAIWRAMIATAPDQR